MAGRAVKVTARIIFVICGAASLVTGFAFVMLKGSELPVQSEWIIYALALGAVGAFTLLMGVLPQSWIAKVGKRERDDPRLFSFPLKALGGFAAFFYLVAAFAYFAPNRWNLDPRFMFPLCPLYFLKMHFDPEPVEIFFMLAPMNAAVYGALGACLAYARLAFQKPA